MRFLEPGFEARGTEARGDYGAACEPEGAKMGVALSRIARLRKSF